MKTTIDIVDEGVVLVNVPEVTDVLGSSAIFPDTRPDNQEGDCIIINCLPATAGQLQTAAMNINICVKNLSLTIGGQPDNSQPDRQRLNAIAKPILVIMKDAVINDMVTEIENVGVYPDKEAKEHFLNIRVRIYSANI